MALLRSDQGAFWIEEIFLGRDPVALRDWLTASRKLELTNMTLRVTLRRAGDEVLVQHYNEDGQQDRAYVADSKQMLSLLL